MKTYFHSSTGSMLLNTLALIVVGGGLMAAMSSAVVSNYRSGGNTQSAIEALYFAESGVEAGVYYLTTNPGLCPTVGLPANTSSGSIVVGGVTRGEYSYGIAYDAVNLRWTITSTGFVPSAAAPIGRRTVTQVVNACATGGAPPIIALGGLNLGNNAEVNGVDIVDNMSPNRGGVDVTGNAWNVTSATFPALPVFPVNSGVDGPITVGTKPAGNYTTANISNNGTLTLQGGSQINSLTMSNNSTLNLAPGTYFIGSMSGGNNGVVNISPPGQVVLYVNTALNLNNNTTLNVGGGGAQNLVVYLYGNASLSNNCNFTGLLIAPNVSSVISLGNNGTMNGALATQGTVNAGNNSDINTTPAALAEMTAQGVSAILAGGTANGGVLLLGQWSESILP
ncbi:MAG: hypothetical protein HQL94_00770 [Magnetococcales bacterium]|nr:hypothetical protein [Magnetococcales bacterium]